MLSVLTIGTAMSTAIGTAIGRDGDA